MSASFGVGAAMSLDADSSFFPSLVEVIRCKLQHGIYLLLFFLLTLPRQGRLTMREEGCIRLCSKARLKLMNALFAILCVTPWTL